MTVSPCEEEEEEQTRLQKESARGKGEIATSFSQSCPILVGWLVACLLACRLWEVVRVKITVNDSSEMDLLWWISFCVVCVTSKNATRMGKDRV